METVLKALPYLSAIIGGWALLNGVLHDIAVLSKHKGGYNRELLRLLMDGHILITCGAMQLIAWKLLQQNNVFGYYIAALASVSLLIYCIMIFPFLKSIGTILLQSGLLIMLIIRYLKT